MKEEVNQELHEFRRLFQVKYDQPADLHDMMAWCLEEIDRMNRQVQKVRRQVSLGHQSVVEEMLSKDTWLHSTYKVNCYHIGGDSDGEEEEQQEEKDEQKEEKEGVEEEVSTMVNVGIKNRNRSAGRILLRIAVAEGHIGITEVLLNRGVNVNGCDISGHTALHLAVEYDDVPIVQLLLQRGADANSESDKVVPIQLSRSSEMVQLLLDAGTDIKARLSHTNPDRIVPSECIFYTALCERDGAPLVEAIIRDYPDSAKYSALVIAHIESGQLSEDHLRALLQDPYAGPFNFVSSIKRHTPDDIVDLICASPWFQCPRKTKEQLKELLDRAIYCGSLVFVSHLLRMGADIEASPVLFNLISQGADRSLFGMLYDIPLALVDLLITNGANTVHNDQHILQYACKHSRFAIVALLVIRGLSSTTVLTLAFQHRKYQTLLDAILSDPSEAEDLTLEKFRNVLQEGKHLVIDAFLIVECMVIKDLPVEESDWSHVSAESRERIIQLHAVLYPVMGLK